MLTFEDEPTIRHAIMKRLDKERGVDISDVLIKSHLDCIAVGILATIDDAIVVRSRFDLPPEFDYRHLHNEIDQVAEQYKAARLDFTGRGHHLRQPEIQLMGTGLRGLWAKHA